MINTVSFEAFGVKYKTKQFAAAKALRLMDRLAWVHPVDLLETTEADGVCLDTPEAINKAILDRAGILAPREVLNGILALVKEANYGFISAWKGVKVPRRFINEAATTISTHADPLISVLIQEDVATLKELEEYYSLEDAFTMFDIVMAKNVNAALSHEAAMNESKR